MFCRLGKVVQPWRIPFLNPTLKIGKKRLPVKGKCHKNKLIKSSSYVSYGHQALTDGGDHQRSHKSLENVPGNEYEQANLYGRKEGGWFMDDEIEVEMEVSDAENINCRLP